MVCNAVCQSNTNTEALATAALAVAGGWKTVGGPTTCSTWYDAGTYDGCPLYYAGYCWYASGGGSTCAAANSGYARLCECYVPTPTTRPSGKWNSSAVFELVYCCCSVL